MIRKAGHWFNGLSKIGKAGVLVTSFIGLSAIGSATNNPHPSLAPANLETKTASSVQLNSQQIAEKKQDVIEHKTESTTEAVPYSTSTVSSSALNKGITKIQTNGVDGIRTHVFDVTYTNGAETSRTETSNQITTSPVNKVVAVGAYVAPAKPSCPNGTYINTYGNTVCRPYETSSAPSGATAKCVDGTYSFSQTHSGTCSHHGGVGNWL